jgi:hypothetical protein
VERKDVEVIVKWTATKKKSGFMEQDRAMTATPMTSEI